MDTLKTVLDSTGIIMQNHIILCIVYALFFIVALIMRRSADNIERKAGKVMIIASVPGLLISVTGIGLFIYATVRGMTMVDDSRVMNPFIYDCEHLMYALIELSIIIFPIQSLFTMISGIVVNSKTTGKLRGWIAIASGILLLGFSIFYTVGYLMLLAG